MPSPNPKQAAKRRLLNRSVKGTGVFNASVDSALDRFGRIGFCKSGKCISDHDLLAPTQIVAHIGCPDGGSQLVFSARSHDGRVRSQCWLHLESVNTSR